MFGFKLTDYDKKVYQEEIDGFLPKKIIDTHTHVYPSFANLEKDVSNGYWPSKVATDWTIEDANQTYLDLFPNQKVIPVIFGNPGTNLEVGNDYVSKAGAYYDYPTCFLTDYYMTPEYLEEQVVKGGFKGLKPYFYACRKEVDPREAGIYDYLPHEHLKVADKLGLTCVLHISKEERLKNKQNIHDLMEIEEKYPNVKLIVAHVGRAYAVEDIGDAFETLKHSKKMMFDFCANTLPEATEKCIEAVGTERLLFGTDMPIAKMRMSRVVENGYYINIVPKGLYGDLTGAAHMREVEDSSNITNFTYEIIRGFKKTAEKLSLSKKDIENIFFNNAAKLYNVKG